MRHQRMMGDRENTGRVRSSRVAALKRVMLVIAPTLILAFPTSGFADAAPQTSDARLRYIVGAWSKTLTHDRAALEKATTVSSGVTAARQLERDALDAALSVDRLQPKTKNGSEARRHALAALAELKRGGTASVSAWTTDANVQRGRAETISDVRVGASQLRTARTLVAHTRPAPSPTVGARVVLTSTSHQIRGQAVLFWTQGSQKLSVGLHSSVLVPGTYAIAVEKGRCGADTKRIGSLGSLAVTPTQARGQLLTVGEFGHVGNLDLGRIDIVVNAEGASGGSNTVACGNAAIATALERASDAAVFSAIGDAAKELGASAKRLTGTCLACVGRLQTAAARAHHALEEAMPSSAAGLTIQAIAAHGIALFERATSVFITGLRESKTARQRAHRADRLISRGLDELKSATRA